MDDEQRYARAKSRVEELRGFYAHLAVYLIVNAGLILIDLLSGDGWWFYWPLLGWGIGLAVHAVNTYVVSGRIGSDWEERKIRELMEKDR